MQRLECDIKVRKIRPLMNFFLAIFAWFMISLVLGVAIFATAVKGVVWALPLALLVFCVMVWRFGCKVH